MVFISIRRLATGGIKFKPMFDRILVEKFAPEVKSKGGIMIPEKAQGKVLEGTIVAAGPGARNEKGGHHAMSVSVGDRVLLPQWGENKVTIDEKEYYLFRESELLGKFDK